MKKKNKNTNLMVNILAVVGIAAIVFLAAGSLFGAAMGIFHMGSYNMMGDGFYNMMGNNVDMGYSHMNINGMHADSHNMMGSSVPANSHHRYRHY